MSAEERKALSFVAILLGLSVVARAMNRPDSVVISDAATVDIPTRLQQNQQVRQQASGAPRQSAGTRRRPAAPPPRRVPAVVIDNREPRSQTREPLDLNRATAAELDALPGITPTVAGRIVQYRTEKGRFVSVEELDSVKGVGPATLSKVRALVRVR